MKTVCTMCKRKNPKSCDKSHCPILNNMSFEKRVDFDPKEDFMGDTPNVFVGSYGYPNVNVGILSTEDYQNNDEPLLWSERETPIGDIVDLRSVMVNSSFKADVKNMKEDYLDIGKEVAMAEDPVDVEVKLKKKPKFRLDVDQDLMPQGPKVDLEKARLTENPRVPKIVDKAVYDDEWKAEDAMMSMYERGIDVHHITKMLSVGNVGVKTERKLVPTRWSITGVDSTISENLREEIKDYQEYGYHAYFGGAWGNYYLVLFFPDVWQYELFETYAPSWQWKETGDYAKDYEPYDGRTGYVDETAGAYYASRLAVTEKLRELQRQLCARAPLHNRRIPSTPGRVDMPGSYQESARKRFARIRFERTHAGIREKAG